MSSGLVSGQAPSIGEMAAAFAALSLFAQLATMCLYMWAALTVWSKVRDLLGEITPRLVVVLRKTGLQIGALLLCALGLLLCFTLIPAIVLPPLFPLLRLPISHLLPLMHGIETAALWIGYLIAAYWVTPRALLLIGQNVMQRQRNTATLFALGAVISSLALRLICSIGERSLVTPDELGTGLIVNAGTSLLSAIPYAVLFVALALVLQNEPDQTVEVVPDSIIA